MPILNIRDLGTVGVNTDVAPWELPPARVERWDQLPDVLRQVQSAGGLVSVADAGDEMGHITPTKNFDLVKWIVMGKDSIKVSMSTHHRYQQSMVFSGLDETCGLAVASVA